MKGKRRYYKELRVAQLRALIELSHGKGFAGAAAVLELSPPSVWQQIRGLEDEFNASLVRVHGQQVSLTEKGEILVELAKPIVQNFDSLRTQFAEQLRSHRLKLRVSAPNSILVDDLPETIREYCSQYPEVSLSLIDRPSGAARKMLEDGEVDLAIVGLLERRLPKTLTVDEMATFPFMLVCPPAHPLLKLKRIRPADLVQYAFVMPAPGTNGRQRVEEVLTRFGLNEKLQIAMETGTKDLLMRYVQMDFGIAVIPVSGRYVDAAIKDENRELAFYDLSAAFGHETIVILRRKVQSEPPHQTEFRELVLARTKRP